MWLLNCQIQKLFSPSQPHFAFQYQKEKNNMNFKLVLKAIQLCKSALYKISPHILFDFENYIVNNKL